MKRYLLYIFVLFFICISSITAKKTKDFSDINMIFLAEQVINSHPILQQIVQNVDKTQDYAILSMDLIRIWSVVDQFAHELNLRVPEVVSSNKDEDIGFNKELCIKAANGIADHLRNLQDETDLVNNLQMISTISDFMPQALIDCGIPKAERKFKKYKSSYVRSKIDPESIE